MDKTASSNSAKLAPPVIGSSVPLPGRVTGRRIVQLDLGLTTNDYDQNTLTGTTYAEAAGVPKSGHGSVNINLATRFLRKKLTKMGHEQRSIERAIAALPEILAGGDEGLSQKFAVQSGLAGEVVVEGTVSDTRPTGPAPDIGLPITYVRQFASAAIGGTVLVPVRDASGNGTVEEVPEDETPEPNLFLIEVYGVSSFLGEYGIGKTIRTFTLLPGESTTIRLKTWQSTKQSLREASSIIDSSEHSATERFSNKLQNETTDKRTKEKTKKWSFEAGGDASWGFGSASAKVGASQDYHAAREQFARLTTETVREHASEASSKRELSITSSVETQVDFGSETSVERVIKNVNMRRVLNFVFRELNQVYTTKLHLKDIRVGFTSGLENTWREVSIAELGTLLTEVLQPAKVDQVAQQILKVAGTVFGDGDLPVRVLEKVVYDPVSDTVEISEARLNQAGQYDPPTSTEYYRFKRGPIAQGETNPVDGVLMSSREIVMRTDSAIVEALLGESDALDNYSMQIQEAAANHETLTNDRDQLLIKTLGEIEDAEARAKAASELYVHLELEENNRE